MASDSLHERFDDLRPETIDLHRAIVSLMEELEAIDWYQQRVDATPDDSLKEVLAHNRDEEIEHAMMNLEWIRRKHPYFDEKARTFLFSEGPITEVEAKMKAAAGAEAGVADTEAEASAAPAEPSASPPNDGSLGIGSLKLSTTAKK